MNDYTPTTNEILATYMRYRGAWNLANGSEAQFYRWLEQVKAEAWDEGFTDGVNHDLGDWDNAPSIINNPYRQETDA